MSTVLDKIIADKRRHIAERQRISPLSEISAVAKNALPVRKFADSLANAVQQNTYGLIAEIKKASPSKGLIRADFDPPALARAYAAGGATCLSVLTDIPYFQGEDAFLTNARKAVSLPALRKDFMVDPYQVTESRALGADCILVIMAAVDDQLAQDLCAAAQDWRMDVLVEVHDLGELDRALKLDAGLIGVNNRNLKTLEVSLETALDLARHIPQDRLAVAESGLNSKADLDRMAEAGFHCFLVGESLMRQSDVTTATRQLLGEKAPADTRIASGAA